MVVDTHNGAIDSKHACAKPILCSPSKINDIEAVGVGFPVTPASKEEAVAFLQDALSLTNEGDDKSKQLPTWTLGRPPTAEALFRAVAEARSAPRCTSTAQSPRSPWLPPSASHGDRTPPKRRLEPLRIAEANGLVLPSWLPYTSPPPSRGKELRKLPLTRWSARHHVCDSKDNRSLPKLQRAYFDDTPNIQAGVHKVSTTHRTKNFDQFCSSPPHLQHQDLHKRFERYPFIKAAEEAASSSVAKDSSSAFQLVRAPSSMSSSSGSPSRSRSPDSKSQAATSSLGMSTFTSKVAESAALRAELESQTPSALVKRAEASGVSEAAVTQAVDGEDTKAALVQLVVTAEADGADIFALNSSLRSDQTYDSEKTPVSCRVATAWGEAESRPARAMKKQASRLEIVGFEPCVPHVNDVLSSHCRCGAAYIDDAQYCKQCGDKRMFLTESEKGRRIGFKAVTSASTSMRTSGLRGERKQKRMPTGTTLCRYSVFAKGGVPQFHAWCATKFGSLVKLWRCLDVHNNMRVGQGQFLRGLQDLGYSGDVRELFKALNRDQTGTLLFYHFAPEAALAVADFLNWARTSYGSLAGIGITDALAQRSFLTHSQFVAICRKKGYDKEEGLQYTFDLIDKDGDGSVVRTDVELLDKWEFPQWLTAEPDPAAAETCRHKLLHRCHGNALLAWRFLNRSGSMRVAWHDFNAACRKLLSAEECQMLPSAWRAMDDDLSGWLSLREFDPDAFDKLMKFVRWTHETYGSTVGAFPKLTGNKDAKITMTEFRHACSHSGLGDEIMIFIFSGLDVDAGGTITTGEIRFLDQWKASSDLKEEEAWAQITSPASKKKAGQERGLTRRDSDTKRRESDTTKRESGIRRESRGSPPSSKRPVTS